MKKYLFVILVLGVVQSAVLAANIRVESMTDFSTARPQKVWQVKTVEVFTTKDNFTIPAGSVITGSVTEVKPPARGKRNASFKFEPTEIVIDGEEHQIKKNYVGKYSSLSDINASDIAKKGAITVGNKLAKGVLGPGIAVIEGAVKNKTGNRAKSVAVSLYESTPLSYANKGKELVIPRGYQFIMNFKEED